MRMILLACAAMAITVPAAAHDSGDSAVSKGEAKLAKMLEGRVAGKP